MDLKMLARSRTKSAKPTLLLALMAVSATLSIGAAQARAAPLTAPIEVTVDATKAPSRVIHTKMVLPVKPGPLTLLYPLWTTTEHYPSGVVTQLSGLYVRAKGQDLRWRRDLKRMDAFHVTVPQGVTRLEVDFDYVLPLPATGRANSSARLLMLRWNNVLLYPEGKPITQIAMHPRLILPEGWKFGSGLTTEAVTGSTVTFAPASMDELADTPVMAGQYYSSTPLAGDAARYNWDIASESPVGVVTPQPMLAQLASVIAQSKLLFGQEHFDNYRFLIAASDQTSAGGGMEHRNSTDMRVPEKFVSEPTLMRSRYNYFSHEYIHSWVGKYRLPADQVTHDSQETMSNDLLWVYEGLTTYLGNVVGARAGMCQPDYCRDHMASLAAGLSTQTGRTWRSLQDTADGTAAMMFADFSVPTGWGSRHREMDFYNEGVLIWLEADTIIRQQSTGKKSLDDFARAFFGPGGKFPEIRPYDADEVFATLERVQPYDWRGFFNTRLNSLSAEPPLGGLERAGWRLVFNKTPNVTMADFGQLFGYVDARFTLGLTVGGDGVVSDVIDKRAANQAGLFPGMSILAVNDQPWSSAVLKSAIEQSEKGGAIRLKTTFAGLEKTYDVRYAGGMAYPHLERIAGAPDLLTPILSAR
jgi:predicted metalloprotease with PDZ domain